MTALEKIDLKTWEWLLENVSDNEMFLDLFLNNPFTDFGNKTILQYAENYGWPSTLTVLKRMFR